MQSLDIIRMRELPLLLSLLPFLSPRSSNAVLTAKAETGING